MFSIVPPEIPVRVKDLVLLNRAKCLITTAPELFIDNALFPTSARSISSSFLSKVFNEIPSTPTVPPVPIVPEFGLRIAKGEFKSKDRPSNVVKGSVITGSSELNVIFHQFPPLPVSLVATEGTNLMVFAPEISFALVMNCLKEPCTLLLDDTSSSPSLVSVTTLKLNPKLSPETLLLAMVTFATCSAFARSALAGSVPTGRLSD